MTSIRGIACALPEREVPNRELADEHPGWDMERVARRTGVRSRRVAAPGETALDLSAHACDALAAKLGPAALEGVDAIVYCTQTPDYRVPGNAGLLHRRLGLADEVLAFDYPLACSGYVYGLAFADSFVRSGLATRVLLVTADTYSTLLDPDDRATRVLFGDGAAVTLLGDDERAGGAVARVVAAELRTRGEGYEQLYVPAGGARAPGGDGAAATIRMDGPGVWTFVKSVVPDHVRSFLAAHSLGVEDVDLVVFHQTSEMTLDALARALGIGAEKMYVRMAEVGNLVSASIPFALGAALDEGAVDAGDLVLLTGFGAGLSYGSVLLEL